ncbi:MAG: DUF1549 domain-containing protein, partial [Planctomycetota bacterium]
MLVVSRLAARTRLGWSTLLLGLLVGVLPAQDPMSDAGSHEGVAPAAADRVDYFRQVRPILTQHCYGCHGPDAEQRATELRFDLRESVFGDLGGGEHAVVPGDVAASHLVLRITSDDPEERMPPSDAKDPLTPEEITTLRRWVEEGASWSDHWAFQPIAAPAPPEGQEGAINPIDAFVRRRLAREGLTPADPADREALIRRVSFDLTGLPPTPEEIDAFLADAR